MLNIINHDARFILFLALVCSIMILNTHALFKITVKKLDQPDKPASFDTMVRLRIKARTETTLLFLNEIMLRNQQNPKLVFKFQRHNIKPNAKYSHGVIFDTHLVLTGDGKIPEGDYSVGVQLNRINNPSATAWDLGFTLALTKESQGDPLFPPRLQTLSFMNRTILNNDGNPVPHHLYKKWKSAFDKTGKDNNIMELFGKKLPVPSTFLSLKKQQYLDDTMINGILQFWLSKKKSKDLNKRVEILSSNLPYIVTQEQVDHMKAIFDTRKSSRKEYFLMPFHTTGLHWYLMIYVKTMRKFIIIDSLGRDSKYSYINHVAVFTYILKNHVGLENVPTSSNVLAYVNPEQSPKIETKQSGSIISYMDPLIVNSVIWYGSLKQVDVHSCGIFTILHAVYLAENNEMIQEIIDNPLIETKAEPQQFVLEFRRNMFSRLGALCEYKSFLQNENDLFFPGCLGVTTMDDMLM